MEDRTVTTDSASTAPDFTLDSDGHLWTVDDGYHTVVSTATGED